jgi:hypothetical protein
VIKVRPNTLTITTSSNEEVTLTLSALKATVDGRWDGRPYLVRSPIAPKGATAVLSRMGNDGFRMELDVGAKVVERNQFRLVGSGSLVEHSTNGEGRELFEDVWDKVPDTAPRYRE